MQGIKTGKEKIKQYLQMACFHKKNSDKSVRQSMSIDKQIEQDTWPTDTKSILFLYTNKKQLENKTSNTILYYNVYCCLTNCSEHNGLKLWKAFIISNNFYGSGIWEQLGWVTGSESLKVLQSRCQPWQRYSEGPPGLEEASLRSLTHSAGRSTLCVGRRSHFPIMCLSTGL